jgi:hypothetical protein
MLLEEIWSGCCCLSRYYVSPVPAPCHMITQVHMLFRLPPSTQEIWLFQLNAAIGEISFLWRHAHQLTMADYLNSKFDFKDDTLAIFWHARTPPEMDVIDVSSAIAGKSSCLKFQRRLKWVCRLWSGPGT